MSFDVVVDCNPRETLCILKVFLKENVALVRNISFQETDNKHLLSLLSKACSKYGVNTTKIENVKDSNERE